MDLIQKLQSYSARGHMGHGSVTLPRPKNCCKNPWV